jgi:hypothetical protein
MEAAKLAYENLCEQLCQSDAEHITPGKMMSAPALKYKGKVFLFFSKPEHMVFKLGKDFNIDQASYPGIAPFNPFKNKGPLAGWFQVPYSSKTHWPDLAQQSLQTFK